MRALLVHQANEMLGRMGRMWWGVIIHYLSFIIRYSLLINLPTAIHIHTMYLHIQEEKLFIGKRGQMKVHCDTQL